jgi:hypothetical protein
MLHKAATIATILFASATGDNTQGGVRGARVVVANAATPQALASPFAFHEKADAFSQSASSLVHRQLKGTKKGPSKKGRKSGDDKPDVKKPGSKGKDQTFTKGDVSVDIKGKSGKFSITRGNMGKSKKGKSLVSVQIDAIHEIAADGTTIVGKSGKIKHSIETMAKQEFEFSVEQDDVDPSLIDDPTITAAKSSRVTFDSTLSTGSTLKMETLLVTSKGVVGTTGDEKWTVLPGDMKFNLLLSGWNWCEGTTGAKSCKEGAGSFVDVDIEVKGKLAADGKEPKEREKKLHDDDDDKKDNDDDKKVRRSLAAKGKNWDLGDGAVLELSDQILIDGNWTKMPKGYPKMATKGGKVTYTFRFPKFAETAFYDPIVGFDNSVETEAEKNAASASGEATTVSMMVVAVLAGLVGILI